MPTQKPHKWRRGKDARHCIECEAPFRLGDMVYTDTAVNDHVACLSSYRESLIKLGILPNREGVYANEP